MFIKKKNCNENESIHVRTENFSSSFFKQSTVSLEILSIYVDTHLCKNMIGTHVSVIIASNFCCSPSSIFYFFYK